MTDAQIAKLEKAGFNHWTKGDYDRLYIKSWDVDGLDAHWRKIGEKLSYTKSAAVSHSKIYVDVKSGEVVVQCEDAYYGDQIRGVVEEMVASVFAKMKKNAQNSISAVNVAKAMKISLPQTRKFAVLSGVAKTTTWKATKTLYSIEEYREMFKFYSSAIRQLKAKLGKVSVKEIANALCLSVSTVYRRIKARGVKLERGINASDIAKIL